MTQPSSGVSPHSSAARSHVAGSLAQLTTEQRERLTEVLDRYLSALEHDSPLAPEALFAEHPDLADALRSYFRSLEDLHDMAAGFGGAARAIEPPEQQQDSAKRIGDFELIREIGRGGMGVVYEARQISLDRRVAVKLLPFAAVLDAKQIARFKHEAQAAAHLHHPNIVPVFAIGVERGVHYYAMQYIDGQPLDRAIEELQAAGARRSRRVQKRSALHLFDESADGAFRPQGPHAPYDENAPIAGMETRDQRRAPTQAGYLISTSTDKSEFYRTVMRLGIQAAEAVHAAHEYGVVHRDIKPSNLLLAADGKLWITDFGLARFQRDASLTRTGDLVGTMRYMSPEQAAGQSALVDHRTDVYSLGVTLYELVCLQPAFPEERGPALLRQIDSYDPPRPRQVQPEIPADLETVILKAMSRDRDERYGTAQQLADDLKCVLDGKATQARPPTMIDRIGRWSRQHRRVVVTAALAALLAVVGLSTSTLLITREWMRAEKGEADAMRRYGQAREMLDRLGMQLAQELDEVPGADHVRRQLLEQTRRYYLDFIQEAKSDPLLRVDAAVTQGKIGTLLELLGSADESLAAHETAADILRELGAADPGDFRIQQQLALAENNFGLALRRLGKIDRARQQFEQAIRRQEKLLARQPRDSAVSAELAQTLCNLGLLQHETHQLSQSQASLQAAIDHFKPALASHPDAVQYKQGLAAALNNLAALYHNERPAESIRLHGQALALLRSATEANPKDLALRRNVASTLNNLGAALSSAQQPEAARAAYGQAIELREELTRLAPARASYRIDLAVSLNNFGMVQSRLGRTDDAEAMFRRSIELYGSLSKEFPANSAIQSSLGGVYNNLGILLERADQLEAAAGAFASAVNHQQVALQIAPDLPRCRELLVKHYESQGRVLSQLGRVDDARQAALATQRITSTNPTLRQP
jgi:hypothetical protein